MVKEAKADSIKTDQSFFGAYPEVAVRRLCDREDLPTRESLGTSPSVVDVLRQLATRIDRSGCVGQTQQYEASQ